MEFFSLSITVCHYPTGASTSNPIEHRLLSEISKHWVGPPLDSYPTILRLISQTNAHTGLRVSATLIRKDYATGQKVSEHQMSKLNIREHALLSEWNYTIRPCETRNVFLHGP